MQPSDIRAVFPIPNRNAMRISIPRIAVLLFCWTGLHFAMPLSAQEIAGRFRFFPQVKICSYDAFMHNLVGLLSRDMTLFKTYTMVTGGDSLPFARREMLRDPQPFMQYIRGHQRKLDAFEFEDPALNHRLEQAYEAAINGKIDQFAHALKRFDQRLTDIITGKADPRPKGLVGFPYRYESEPLKVSPLAGKMADIRQVEFTVKQGTIDEIVVYVREYGQKKGPGNEQENGQEMEFRNYYPIPLHSKADIYFPNIKLYDERNRKPGASGVYILLKEVMEYHPRLGQSKDFSPRDGAYVIDSEALTEDLWVEKPDLRYFLRANVFTDFKGFGANDPNGLVQTEFSYQQLFNTHNVHNSHLTWLNAIGLDAGISKIENKDPRLVPSSDTLLIARADRMARVEAQYVRTLDYFRFSNFFVRPRLNIFKRNLDRFNATFRLDLSLPLYGTSIAVSPTATREVLAWGLSPEIQLFSNPLERLSIEIALSTNYIQLFDRRLQGFGYRLREDGSFQQVGGLHRLAERTLLRARVQLSYSRNGYDYFYVRPMLNWNRRSSPDTFWQAQVGYSIDVQKLLTGRAPEELCVPD